MKNPRYLVAIRLFKGEILPKGLERRDKSRLLTLRKQCLGDLFAALCVTHESECNRDAFTSQETVVLLVCNRPDFSQGDGRELGSVEEADCGVASDDAQLLGVAFLEYLVGQSDLCLRRGEIAGHCAQNLQGIRGNQGEPEVREDESLRLKELTSLVNPDQASDPCRVSPPLPFKVPILQWNQTPLPAICAAS